MTPFAQASKIPSYQLVQADLDVSNMIMWLFLLTKCQTIWLVILTNG